MGIAETIGIAIGLGVDCLAISAGLGAAGAGRGLMAFTATMFGFFQWGMALGGMLGGRAVEGLLASPVRLAAPALIAAIGVIMIVRGIRCGETSLKLAGILAVVGLAVTTSLDALATGVAFGLMDVVSVGSAVLIGAVSVVMSAAGFAGGKMLARYTGIAEDIGGALLIGLALMMLFSLR